MELQSQTEAPGPIAPPDHVFSCEYRGQVVVGNLETGEIVELDNVAADMWRAIVGYGKPGPVLQALMRKYDVDRVAMNADLAIFLEDLFLRGLLQEGPVPEGPVPIEETRLQQS